MTRDDIKHTIYWVIRTHLSPKFTGRQPRIPNFERIVLAGVIK